MKVLKYALPALAIAGSSSFIAPAAQAAEVSGNVALVTDYRFRGISQSDSKPSIQGGFDIAFDSGFYLGTWGAAVDFDCSSDPVKPAAVQTVASNSITTAATRTPLLAAWASTWATSITTTPRTRACSAIMKKFTATSASAASPQGLPTRTSTGLRLKFVSQRGLQPDTPGRLGSGLSGRTSGLRRGQLHPHRQARHWAVSLSKSWQGIDWSLTYEDTDLSEEDCYGYDWCDATVIFGMAKSL